MSHPQPTRILIHRPDLVGKPRPARTPDAQLKANTPAAVPPPVVYQAVTVVGATARWFAAGRPKRTPEQLAEVRAICSACPHWDPAGWLGKGRCRKCGCAGIKQEWSTERCPDEPPRWLAIHVDK